MKLLFALSCLVAASSAAGEFHSFHETFDTDTDNYHKLDRKSFDVRDFPWRAPAEGQVRSSCPFLSTCANHGIIKRSGKNIHFEELYRCAHFGGFGKTLFRISRNSFSKIAKIYRDADLARGLSKENAHAPDRISLDETSYHGPIEHDLSFTRLDVGDQPDFELNRTGQRDLGLLKGLFAYATRRRGCNVQITDQWLLNPVSSRPDEACYLDTDDMGAWFQDRKAMEEKRHAQLGYKRKVEFGFREMFAAGGEATFFVRLMGRHGKIPLEHARIFTVFQRFPDDWRPRDDTFHFPHAVTHILEMIGSYLAPRGSKDDAQYQKLKDEYGSPSKTKVYEYMVADYKTNKPGCDGQGDECEPYELAILGD
jgi:hypothetical protein